MAKDEVSEAFIQAVRAEADADAKAARRNQSEIVERALRDEQLCIALEGYTMQTVAALNIDAYARQVYQANRESGSLAKLNHRFAYRRANTSDSREPIRVAD